MSLHTPNNSNNQYSTKKSHQLQGSAIHNLHNTSNRGPPWRTRVGWPSQEHTHLQQKQEGNSNLRADTPKPAWVFLNRATSDEIRFPEALATEFISIEPALFLHSTVTTCCLTVVSTCKWKHVLLLNSRSESCEFCNPALLPTLGKVTIPFGWWNLNF